MLIYDADKSKKVMISYDSSKVVQGKFVRQNFPYIKRCFL